MAYLVLESKQQNISCTILFSELYRKIPADYLLDTDGSVRLYSNEFVDYHLSDSVDIPNFQHINRGAVLITSEKSDESSRFTKMASSNYSSNEMEVWSFEELCEISPPSFNNIEMELRYEIFGGSARNFLGLEQKLKSDESYAYVNEVMSWMFAVEKLSIGPDRWNFISSYIIDNLARCSNQKGDSSKNSVSSLMWHTNNGLGYFWASKFMSFVAGEILRRQDSTIKETLKSVIGGSGLGYAFEYLGHRELLREGERRTYQVIGLGRGNKGFETDFLFPLRLQKFRKIEDIHLLADGCYGMPYVCNFPIIDAVIQPDILLQYCTGKIHNGASSMLATIREQLHEKDRKKHKMIFINDNVVDFGQQVDLGDIRQYVMSYTSV
jgi:hypothetical protein